MPDAEFPEYSIRYSKNAQALRDELSAPLRVTLIEIENDLTDDPHGNPARLVRLRDTLFIYRHAQPRLEVTYDVDTERKVVTVHHLVAPALEMTKTLFISYSHADQEWLLELKKWLKPLEQRDIVSVWDDQRIKAGADWRREIEKALAAAKAAVLLISVDFLNSEFIANNELPQLLNAAADRGLQVFWIAVRPSTVADSAIARYQAVHKEPPLNQLEPAQREAQFLRIYERIKEAIDA